MSGIVGSRHNIRGSGLVGSLGTDGQVFTSAGAGTGAIFEDAAGGTNTPMFRATVSAEQAIPTSASTKIEFDTEVFDPQSTYDHATNYRWTPAAAGYVFVGAKIRSALTDDMTYFQVRIFKNGSAISIMSKSHWDYESKEINIIDLADDDDYYEAFCYHNKGSDGNIRSNTSEMQFFGYTLIT